MSLKSDEKYWFSKTENIEKFENIAIENVAIFYLQNHEHT